MKSRVQSKIAKMPPHQQQQILDWMSEGLIYPKIQRRIQEAFGVSISTSSLSTYYSKHGREILASQTSRSASAGPLHLTLVLHVQIRPELLQLAPSSDGTAEQKFLSGGVDGQ